VPFLLLHKLPSAWGWLTEENSTTKMEKEGIDQLPFSLSRCPVVMKFPIKTGEKHNPAA